MQLQLCLVVFALEGYNIAIRDNQVTKSVVNISGSLSATTVQMDIFWKEKDGDSEWVSSIFIFTK